MVDKIKGGLADNKSLQDIADKHSVSLSVIESALADGIAVEIEHTDDKATATEIAKDHLFEDAEYYSKLSAIEKQNSKDWAKTYKASNFIEKGVCTYNDETIYLSQEALNKAIQSIKGRPVVIKHQKVTPQNMEDHAVGYVSDCGFCSDDASFYCNFLVFDDEGKEVIAKDYSVSCAYIPKAFGIGGTWHNTPYDREVTELEFTHLALVPDPRYEDAKIYENAKGEDMDKKNEAGHWITVKPHEDGKGSHLFVKEGQTAKEAIDDKFGNKSDKKYDYNQDNEVLTKDLDKISDIDRLIELKTYNESQEKRILKGNLRPTEITKDYKIYESRNAIIDRIIDRQKRVNISTEKTKTDIDKVNELKDKLAKQGYDIKISDFITDNRNMVNYKETILSLEKKLQKEKTEKQNSTDNTTKETYNMEKIEVEQGFLASLMGLVGKQFTNAKEEGCKEKDEKDEDELEYEGKKYSKKELINAFSKMKENELKEDEKSKADKKEDEKEKENSLDDDIQFYNSMKTKMGTAQENPNDKIKVYTQKEGLDLGSKIFG